MSWSNRRRSSNPKYETKSYKKRPYSPERYHAKDFCEEYEEDKERRSCSRSNSSENGYQRYNRNQNSKYSHHHSQHQRSRRNHKHSSSSPSKSRSAMEYHRGHSNRHHNNYDERVKERDRERERERERSNSRPHQRYDENQQQGSEYSKLISTSSSRCRRSSSRSLSHSRSYYDPSVPSSSRPKTSHVSEDNSDDYDNDTSERREHKYYHKYHHDKREESSGSKHRNYHHHRHHERYHDNEHDSRNKHYKNQTSEISSKENADGKSKRSRNSLEKKQKSEDDSKYYQFDTSEPIDKERIHREIEEKLRIALAKEGKVYPPPKSEASHPVFANDGSFLEVFKKMQEQQQCNVTGTMEASSLNGMEDPGAIVTTNTSSVFAGANSVMTPNVGISVASVAQAPMVTLPVAGTTTSSNINAGGVQRGAAPPVLPVFGRRRGGKILKTGMVAKPKMKNEGLDDPKDFWSLYLAEVNKYKNTACETETGNRPLVK